MDVITNDDGNVEGDTEAGDETNEPTGTEENRNDYGGQWKQVMTTKSGRVSGRGKTLTQEQAKELRITLGETNYYVLLSEVSK